MSKYHYNHGVKYSINFPTVVKNLWRIDIEKKTNINTPAPINAIPKIAGPPPLHEETYILTPLPRSVKPKNTITIVKIGDENKFETLFEIAFNTSLNISKWKIAQNVT